MLYQALMSERWVTTPHASRGWGFWIDTGVSSHTDSSGRRTPVRQAQTTGVSHGISNVGYVTAFTRGNDLPRNAPSSIQVFVYKRTTHPFFFCMRKAEMCCLRAARMRIPTHECGGLSPRFGK